VPSKSVQQYLWLIILKIPLYYYYAYCGIIFIKGGCKTKNKIMSKDWKEQKGNKKWPPVKVAVSEPKSHSPKVSPVIDVSISDASIQDHVSPIVSPESSNDEKGPRINIAVHANNYLIFLL
jgi:hypothetical protein